MVMMMMMVKMIMVMMMMTWWWQYDMIWRQQPSFFQARKSSGSSLSRLLRFGRPAICPDPAFGVWLLPGIRYCNDYYIESTWHVKHTFEYLKPMTSVSCGVQSSSQLILVPRASLLHRFHHLAAILPKSGIDRKQHENSCPRSCPVRCQPVNQTCVKPTFVNSTGPTWDEIPIHRMKLRDICRLLFDGGIRQTPAPRAVVCMMLLSPHSSWHSTVVEVRKFGAAGTTSKRNINMFVYVSFIVLRRAATNVLEWPTRLMMSASTLPSSSTEPHSAKIDSGLASSFQQMTSGACSNKNASEVTRFLTCSPNLSRDISSPSPSGWPSALLADVGVIPVLSKTSNFFRAMTV